MPRYWWKAHLKLGNLSELGLSMCVGVATQTLIAELCNSKEPECQKIIQNLLGHHSKKCESYHVYFFETDCSLVHCSGPAEQLFLQLPASVA